MRTSPRYEHGGQIAYIIEAKTGAPIAGAGLSGTDSAERVRRTAINNRNGRATVCASCCALCKRGEGMEKKIMFDKRKNRFSKDLDEAEASIEAVIETDSEKWNEKTRSALLMIVDFGFDHFTNKESDKKPIEFSEEMRASLLPFGEKEIIKAFIALSVIHNIFPRLFADVFPWTGMSAPFDKDILMECGNDIRSTLRAYYSARKTTEIPDFAKDFYKGDFLNI